MHTAQFKRLAEKLHRLAYELEHDASRLQSERPSYGNSVRDISRSLGTLARHMGEEIT
jgi:hypothetical protein